MIVNLEQEFPIAFLTAGVQEGEAALSLAISFSTLPVYIAFLFNRTEPSDSDGPSYSSLLSTRLWDRGVSDTKSLTHQQGNLKTLRFPKPPLTALVSKKYNGYFSVSAICLMGS